MTAPIQLDLTEFKAQFPLLASTADSTLEQYFKTATYYVSNKRWRCVGRDQQKEYIYLMTAHLAALSCIVAGGEVPGMTTQATIDKVSVTMQPPPERNQFQWWLNLTPYGQQLLAMLSMNSVGGVVVGGQNNRMGFRGAGGWGR